MPRVVWCVLLASSIAGIAGPVDSDEPPAPFGLRARTVWTTSRVVGSPEPPPPYDVARVFPQWTFDHPVFIAEEPGTSRILVAELGGKIYACDKNAPAAESKSLFLEFPREIFAFSLHPGYERNGQVFVFSPKEPNTSEEGQRSRISRFVATGDKGRRCSADSETIIIDWPAGGHNGGEAIFGPDGYLYVSTGDSTSGSDPKGTGQGVDDLFSVIMRLDVDHPADGRPYSVPPDNPFVTFPGARPEIWAFGFRNPWRMSFDSKTGQLWVGDVGQDLWEMIWVVQRGGNYGWSVQEGSHAFHPQKTVGPGPIQPPVVEHHHTECRSITGGYAYHGDKFPELQGCYFYGDYEYGKVWGLRYDGSQVTWHQELADTSLRIASFGTSSSGDIYLIDHPSGELYQLVRAPAVAATGPFPRKLSETGLFQAVADHELAAGVISYSVNAPQWLDSADKQRFVALPGETTIEFVERSTDANTWKFADGTVTGETISVEMEAGNTASRRRIETRIMVKQQSHWLGYSYVWNEAQTDAELAPTLGLERKLTIRDSAAPDGIRQQTWRVPSRNECMVCHSRAAGFVLGLNTPQMNRDYLFGPISDNQLRAWNHVGLFGAALAEAPAHYQALPNPYDTTVDVDARARAWLHVNCSVCHVADGGGNARMQLRFDQKLAETNLVDERPLHGNFGLRDAKIVVPGDPFASVLFYRLSKWGRGRMPHVGSLVHDEQGLQLIRDWIQQLVADGQEPEHRPPAANGAHPDYEQTAKSIRLASELPEDLRTGRLAETLDSPRDALLLATVLAEDTVLARDTLQPAWRQQILSAGLAAQDPNIHDLFERFLPEGQRTQRLGESFDSKSVLSLTGNSELGRQLFVGNAAQCKNCHRLPSDPTPPASDTPTTLLGPDLSGIGKKYQRADLLESLVDPSKKMEPKFVTYTLTTVGGQVLTGILVEKSDDQVVLNVLQNGTGAQVRVPADEVDELQPQKKSLMPDLLLRDFTAQQAADLVEFLSTLK